MSSTKILLTIAKRAVFFQPKNIVNVGGAEKINANIRHRHFFLFEDVTILNSNEVGSHIPLLHML